MKPLVIIAAGLVGTVVIVGGIVLVTKKDSNKSVEATQDTNTKEKDSKSSSNEVTIKDPNGDYKLYSDPSITKQPTKDMVIGNGQLVSLEYDGSKSEEGSSLFYDLYYVDTTGAVIPMTGGTLEGDTKGTFSRDIMVFTSDAHGRPGFMEVTTVTDSGLDSEGKITGKNVKLGMYAVKFQVAE